MFDGQPWFDGFRDLATNGVDKAVLNAFRMLGKLGGEWLATSSSGQLPLDEILARGVRDAADVGCVATRDESGVSILVWNYHDDDADLDSSASLTIDVEGLPDGPVRLSEFRMDADHGNAFGAWKAMGSPQDPSPAQVAELEEAGMLAQLAEERRAVTDGKLQLACTLPRQGVGLFRLEG
jgi:xylan 1,4-beta-xylosidase